MRLDHLLSDVDVLEHSGDASPEVTAVIHDSRVVVPGALFCCLPGQLTDGHDHAPAAVEAGARALLCERILDLDIAQVRVESARPAMAKVAAAFWGHPSRSLAVCGVTGTNGKTTVTHLLAAVLEAHGWGTEIIGTLSGPRTTPEAPELQADLARARDAGRQAVAMEVSSHALSQHRVDGVLFAVAGFTNLSQDHLDYHGDMAAYFAAKASLFLRGRAEQGVANADDEHGRRLLDQASIPMHPFSRSDAAGLVIGATGSSFLLRGEPVALPMGGPFNVDNALCAAAMAECLGVPSDVIAAGLSSAEAVPGRYEAVDAGQGYAVIVDYAHTPDGLAQLLRSVRQGMSSSGRLIAVFGCGGDRDAGKRPAMGSIASELADFTIVTSDNPRSEDPLAIIEAIVANVPVGAALEVMPDRREAIGAAVAMARQGDAVVIAGKGHETGQTTGGTTLPFDDRVVARAAIEART